MSMLPPCRICGEKASGFHYGVNTCEACKAFFRRSLSKYETYVCNQNKTCELPPGRRNFCALCRFKRCVLMGMCRNAIKTGRYTHEKKANDIKELKGMKEWSAPAEDQAQVELQERLEVLQKEQQLLALSPNANKRNKLTREKTQKRKSPGKRSKKVKEEPKQLVISETDENAINNFHNSPLKSHASLSSIVDDSNESTISDIASLASVDDIDSPFLYSPSLMGCVELLNSPVLYSPPSTNSFESADSSICCSQTDISFAGTLRDDMHSLNYTTNCIKTIEDPEIYSSMVTSSAEDFMFDFADVSYKSIESHMICSSSLTDSFESIDDQIADSQTNSLVVCSHSQEQIEILEKVIKRIKDAHDSNTLYTPEFLKSLPDREKQYMRQKELKMEMFGPMKPMSRAEYMSVYQATGIDVDGRREMMQMAIPHMELSIKRFICYVKAIPGFNDLTVDDQICLIKSKRFYHWMIQSHRSFNHELRLHASCDGRIISADEMSTICDTEKDQIGHLFDLQKRIKDLDLTDEEAAVFTAFCVMSADHYHQLQRSDIAERSKELLLNCLLHLFEKHHPEDETRLSKFIDCYIYLQSSLFENAKVEEQIANDWAGIIDFPPVLYEIWSS